jgi:molybdenum cofactor cytidylyltransferase
LSVKKDTIKTGKMAGVLLAAGASERMGKTKQLLPAGEGILLERVLNEMLKSDLDWVVLVLGHRAREIRSALGQALKHPKLKVIENRQYHQGVSSSVIAGLVAVETTYDHVMILLGDIPRVDSGIINHVRHQYLASGLPVGAVKIGTKKTHPVIFSRELYGELHRLEGDVGGRPLLDKYAAQACLVEPEKPYDDRDIDTPEDYAEFVREQENHS